MTTKTKPALAIMAAGLGQRYGGLKQLSPVHGHILMEYAIYDALKSGFGKVALLLRRDFADSFKEEYGARIEAGAASFGATVHYVYQDSLDEIRRELPFREKMWGTGNATMIFQEVIDEPFVVINADDFYGRGSFETVKSFFDSDDYDPQGAVHALAGYYLKNVVSPHGHVARGVCHGGEDQLLANVVEHDHVVLRPDGSIVSEHDGREEALDPQTLISMNFWAFNASIFPLLQRGFDSYLAEVKEARDSKREFYLSDFVGGLIEQGTIAVRILPTAEQWYGMTYQQDREAVEKAMGELVAKGVYPEKLWE